jgi:preprotein translocase subunit SecD
MKERFFYMNWTKTLRVASVFIVIIVALLLSLPLKEKINLGLDLQGGSHIILECIDTPNAPVDNDAVNRALEIIRNRIDQLGVSEPLIQRQGERRILVQLPGIEDSETAAEIIGKTALLEFKNEKGETQLTGANLINAKASFDQFSRSIVLIEFDKIGAKEFGEATKNNVGKILSITLDGKEITSPRVNEPILNGNAEITGNFTVDSAKQLALLLRSGALPVKVEILEIRSVGPTLGKDSIAKGIKAGIAGLILTLIFMLIYYKGFGLIADFALVVCMLLIIGALAGLKATLTLPGIAGIILTIGMAVDANILIFERIKEELRLEKTFRASIDAGFNKAFSSIFDSNLTTLVAAFALFYFGSGPIKGFAVTLSIGILASMFTAIVVTKIILELIANKFSSKALL